MARSCSWRSSFTFLCGACSSRCDSRATAAFFSSSVIADVSTCDAIFCNAASEVGLFLLAAAEACFSAFFSLFFFLPFSLPDSALRCFAISFFESFTHCRFSEPSACLVGSSSRCCATSACFLGRFSKAASAFALRTISRVRVLARPRDASRRAPTGRPERGRSIPRGDGREARNASGNQVDH